MSRINLLGSGVAGRSLPVTAQVRKNVYTEIIPDGDKASVVAYGMPGFKLLYDTGSYEVAPLHYDYGNDYLFFLDIDQARLYLYQPRTAPGTAPTNLGSLRVGVAPTESASYGWCEITEEIVVCATRYTRTSSEGLRSSVAGAAVTTVGPAGVTPTCVTYAGSRFVCSDVANVGRFYWSDLQDGTSWPALNYSTADEIGVIQRMIFWKDTLVIFGEGGIAFYSITEDASAPYQRVTGVKTNVGLVDRYSLGVIGDQVIFLSSNNKGGRNIARLNGYEVVVQHLPDLPSVLMGYRDIYQSGCFGYAGHEFYWLSVISGSGSPIVMGFDMTTNTWIDLEGSRLRGTVNCPDQSASSPAMFPLAGLSTGQLVFIRGDYYTYRDVYGNVDDIARSLVLPHVHDADNANNLIVNRFRLDTGGTGPEPQLSVSRDGGTTYGTASAGSALNNVREWRRLGKGRTLTLKIEATGSTGPLAWINAFADIEVLDR